MSKSRTLPEIELRDWLAGQAMVGYLADSLDATCAFYLFIRGHRT